MNIYDELNYIDNPYKVLRISKKSDDNTIKEAYKLLKKSCEPGNMEKVEMAYNLIKTRENRIRYSLLNNAPFESIDDIKDLGVTPKRLSKKRWIELIRNNNPKS